MSNLPEKITVPNAMPMAWAMTLPKNDRSNLNALFVINAHRFYGDVDMCLEKVSSLKNCEVLLRCIEDNVAQGLDYDDLEVPFMLSEDDE